MTSDAADHASGHDLDAAADFFDGFRNRLFGIAYRMLGSVAEAEDVVQEAWLRWQQTDRSVVRNPSGFLTTVTTRLALNTLESARLRREEYVGSWLPEPVDTGIDPMLGAETAEALEAAVLVVMEKLTPEPRAAYVLREASRYPYEDIAEILDTTTVNARQMVSRAKKHVQSSRSEPVEPGRHRALLEAFVAAARDGDLGRLEQVLAADVVSISDGAGMAPRSARRPIFGRDRVIRFVAGWADWWIGATLAWIETNGQPSVLVTREAAAVLAAARGTDMHAYITLSLATGARTEELRALTWAHLDLTGDLASKPPRPPTIQVWRSVRETGDTKTKRSRRTLRLPAVAVEALTLHRREQDHRREAAGDSWTDNDLVFCTDSGLALDSANVRRAFRSVVRRAGLVDGTWTPRELRHSFVSILSEAGVPLEEIARLVGHRSTTVTEAVYRKQLRPVLTEGAEAMDRIFVSEDVHPRPDSISTPEPDPKPDP